MNEQTAVLVKHQGEWVLVVDDEEDEADCQQELKRAPISGE